MFILPYDSLPKTSSGKIKRVLLKDLYLSKKLKFIEKLDDSSIDTCVDISNIDQRIIKDFGIRL